MDTISWHMNATQGGANLHPCVKLLPGASLHPVQFSAHEHGLICIISSKTTCRMIETATIS